MIHLYATKDQRDVILCQKRYLACFAGRRWGKTKTILNRGLFRCRVPKFKWTFVSPVYAQVEEAFDSLATNPGLTPFIRKHKLQPFPRIWFTNGSVMSFRSFERPKNIRGRGEDEVWADEIQDYAEEDFLSVLQPVISDRRGTLGIAGQFRGENWYWERYFVPGQSPDHPTHKSWRFPSSSGLMYEGDEGQQELAATRLLLPKAVYNQEYECVPIANQAAVFDPDDVKACVRGSLSPPAGATPYILGVDIGRVVDHTAAVVLDTRTCTVVHAERFPLKTKHDLCAAKVAMIAARYRAQVIIDSTGGATGGKADKADEHVKFYRDRIPDLREYVWSFRTKQRLVHNLSLAFEQKKISIPPACDDLIKEVLAYEFKRTGDRYVFSAPQGQHDDYLAALMMAVWGWHAEWGPALHGRGPATLLY